MNKYEFTRSIRFALNGDISTFDVKTDMEFDNVLKEFLNNYREMLELFTATVFKDEKVKGRLKINYKWLRNYAKDEYNELQDKKVKNYSINEAKFLGKIFQNWIDLNNDLLDQFFEVQEMGEYEKVKRADIAYYTKQFLTHDYFSFVAEFVQYVKGLESSIYLKKLRENIEKTEKLAERVNQNLAPNQYNGVEVARGSFNYYTVNKVSKNFDKNLEEVKNKFVKLENLNKEGYKTKKTPEDKYGFLKKVGLQEDIKSMGLADLYDVLVEFKSQKKFEFIQFLDQAPWRENISVESKNYQNQKNIEKIEMGKLNGRTFSLSDMPKLLGVKRQVKKTVGYSDTQKEINLFLEWVKKDYPLFEFASDNKGKEKSNAEKFLGLTKEIKELGKEKNQAEQINDFKKKNILDKDIRDRKLKRGGYFKGNYVFKNYFDFLEIKKKIAIKIGNIRAEILSLEQEKIEARLVKYWVHIVEVNGRKNILPVPKEKMQAVKEYLKTVNNRNSNIVLYDFNSLTLRALKKLIRKNAGKDIEKLKNSPIDIYKKALRGGYPNIKLDFTGFEYQIKEVIEKDDYKDEEDFRIALETIAYSIKKIYLTEDNLEKLRADFDVQIFEITSYDLNRKPAQLKEHTQLWNLFWDQEKQGNGYDIRINPEVRLFYRKTDKNLPKEKRHNRFSKNQLTVAFTLTQNAAKERVEMSFKDEDQIVSIIKKFNQDVVGKFIKEKGNDLYYYGIDRGNQELATLCVTQFSDKEYEVMTAKGKKEQLNKPIFPEINVYEIKDLSAEKEITVDIKGNKKNVNIIDNPSFFINEIDNYFILKNTAFIDLTIAKLIKGNIVLNGDIKTYLALKVANAKRKLFDIFSKIHSEAQIEYCGDEDHKAWDIRNSKGLYFLRNSFVIKYKEQERGDYQILCYYNKNLFQYRSIEDMLGILQSYLDDLRGDNIMENITVERINNLRDAITANMVGIIAYLFEKYPGIINLENLHSKENIAEHFKSNNENIARRLEWSLYKKFQKSGFVPPRLRQTIFLKEEHKINQFGIIHYVPTKNTSARCPYCEECTPMKIRNVDKFGGEHFFHCRVNKNCEFTTKDPKEPLEKITNSDQVAAYNIAKSKTDNKDKKC